MVNASDSLTLFRYRRINQAYSETLGEDVSLTLMLIPSGEFVRGADEGDKGRRVTVSQFMMGRYPITQAQWAVVAGYDRIKRDLNPNPSRFKGETLPVEQVSWDDASEFCQRLSNKTGRDYRLPTEAEWEYACRAGTTTAYHFGKKLTPELANYNGERGQTSQVGRYPANRWGLHDMHGNVWEWCQDQWHENYKGAPTDGSAWISSDERESRRILRGGSWGDGPVYCRSALRDWIAPGSSNSTVGFRVVCAIART